MRIYVLCDMEGTSGIWRPDQTDWNKPAYEQARELLMADVNACIAGAFEGGATEIVVCDTHCGGPNFDLARMDPRATYETPTNASPMPSLDESFAGLILTGHHAMAGTFNGFLDHTMSAAQWFRFCINGQPVGEIGMETAHAGHFGVPLLMVSGDEAACREAEALCPGIVTVAVKRGLGRNCAHCLSPETAHALIRQGAAEAVRRAGDMKPWRPACPIELELTLYRSDYADEIAMSHAHLQRVDARTVRWQVKSAAEVCRF